MTLSDMNFLILSKVNNAPNTENLFSCIKSLLLVKNYMNILAKIGEEYLSSMQKTIQIEISFIKSQVNIEWSKYMIPN